MIIADDSLRDWLAQRGHPVSQYATCVGRVVGGRVTGAWALDNFTGYDVEHIYAGEPGWMTHALARLVFTHVFEVLGCDRCTALIRADNTRSISIARRAGFRLEGTKRRADRGCDVHVFGMLKEECQHGWWKQSDAGSAGQYQRADPRERTDEPGEHVGAVRLADVHDRARWTENPYYCPEP